MNGAGAIMPAAIECPSFSRAGGRDSERGGPPRRGALLGDAFPRQHCCPDRIGRPDDLGRGPYAVAVQLTSSYATVLPPDIIEKYELVEVRNAAAVLQSSNPGAFREIVEVLQGFRLSTVDVVKPGGNKGTVASRLDRTFRELGWREGRHDTVIESILSLMPYAEAGETNVVEVRSRIENPGYKVDNVKDRVALDVEWNAKDGNLDRDVAAYRALYDAGIIDVGVVVTRHYESILALARRLGREKGLAGRTTTNIGKLIPRLGRGDGGGCPVLVLGITDRSYDATAIFEPIAEEEGADDADDADDLGLLDDPDDP